VVESIVEDRVQLRFEEPQDAVTPGQVVTLYADSMVFGGGWIDSPSGSDLARECDGG
jgi:tRNA U34 2-thiouridine synthase MnmA/TrmU